MNRGGCGKRNVTRTQSTVCKKKTGSDRLSEHEVEREREIRSVRVILH